VRFISGYDCEKGTVESREKMLAEQKSLKELRGTTPNLVADAARSVFAEYDFEEIPKANTKIDKENFYPIDALHHLSRRERRASFIRSSEADAEYRRGLKIGIPRLLNMFYYSPFFSTYLRTLGVGGVVYSDYTSEKLWAAGNKFGAIDPCFPAKVAPAHIYNLFGKDVDAICFPIITQLESTVGGHLGNTACTIQMGTPEVVEAVFSRERDYYIENSIEFWDPALRMDTPVEVNNALFEYFGERLKISRDESAWAVNQAFIAQKKYLAEQREKFIGTMNQLIDEDRLGLLLIGHPYHHDPGLNHSIPEEFRKLGYPIFTIESLPASKEFLEPLFPDVRDSDGLFNINDVWQRSFNRNTNHKVWAAKIAARHPNMAVIDLSSFKCGHDAPTYAYVDQILDSTNTPHFMFHDIDHNKPGASFKIRVQTIDYFLKLEEEKMQSGSLKESV
jgi:predicted nucleotide-binding protein (sugar kinase/HSP70/actin superfamily)